MSSDTSRETDGGSKDDRFPIMRKAGELNVGSIQLTLVSPLFCGDEGRPQRPVVPLFNDNDVDRATDPLDEFAKDVGHDTFSFLHRPSTTSGVTLRELLSGGAKPSPVRISLRLTREQALEVVSTRQIDFESRTWQLDIRGSALQNLIEGLSTVVSASSRGETTWFALLIIPQAESGVTDLPLADEIIVFEDDLFGFLEERVVPGARGLPCLLHLSPSSVREIVDFGSTLINIPGNRTLSVIVAKSPESLIRPGSASIQHIWQANSAEFRKVQKLRRQIATIADQSRLPRWEATASDAREPQLALRTRWRIELQARVDERSFSKGGPSAAESASGSQVWSLPMENLRAFAADMGASPIDLNRVSFSALAPAAVVPVAGQRNVEAIRSLIEHALFAFFDRDTAISSTDGRYAGQICSAKVSFVTNSDEVRILMRNPADPDRVDVSFVLQHQSALESELVRLGFEKGLMAMRKAARLDPNLEGGSNENRIPDGLHAQSMLSEQELAEAYRLLGHFEANKAAHSEKLFNAASMLDRLSLVEAALRKRVGRVPCGALQSRIETLKNGRICVAVDPDSLWGVDYLLKQMRELFSGTSTFEFRSPD